jgi:hypothetical protein
MIAKLTWSALANESTRNVDASSSSGTDVRICGALVDVLALVRHSDLPVTFGADTHEGADDVLAVVAAVVRLRLALVQVHAVTTVGSEGVAVRADASERARHVVTSEESNGTSTNILMKNWRFN